MHELAYLFNKLYKVLIGSDTKIYSFEFPDLPDAAVTLKVTESGMNG